MAAAARDQSKRDNKTQVKLEKVELRDEISSEDTITTFYVMVGAPYKSKQTSRLHNIVQVFPYLHLRRYGVLLHLYQAYLAA